MFLVTSSNKTEVCKQNKKESPLVLRCPSYQQNEPLLLVWTGSFLSFSFLAYMCIPDVSFRVLG